MAPLTDPTLLTAYKNSLENDRRFDGYVEWTEVAQSWVGRELDGVTPDGVIDLIYDYVISGGQIDQVRERRPEWYQHEYHYDLRIEMDGRKLYVETRLMFEDPSDPDDPRILVANVHYA